MWQICLAASASAAALQMFGEIAPDGSGFCELRQGYGGAGVGNMCTFNFNLIYRFHTSIPVEWSATDPPPTPPQHDNTVNTCYVLATAMNLALAMQNNELGFGHAK